LTWVQNVPMVEKLKRLRAPQKSKRIKLALGFGLMIGSLAAVTLVIAANDHTEEFLIAVAPVASGSTVSEKTVTTAKLNLGSSASLYLHPGELPSGSYLLFSIGRGQLIPRASVASQIIDAREPVVVSSTMPLPTGLKAGDLVDVWSSALTDRNLFSPPVSLVLSAEVTDVRQPTGMFASQQPEVQLLVPSESVAPILDAIASKDALSLVLKRNLGNG